MDLNIVPLVRVLNAFDGIDTVSSCGGHENPGPAQYEAGSWYVKFRVEWNEAGRSALEFLSWSINNEALKAGRDVILYPYAQPPDYARPGEGLSFVLEGHNEEDPIAFAAWLERMAGLI